MKEPKPTKEGTYIVKQDPDYEFISVYSEIPWEKYVNRMLFSGRIKKGATTSTRSITMEKNELRQAEIIKEAHPNFQCISDVLRDALKKGLAIDYDILVRRKHKIKLRADATFNEMAMIDEELAIIAHVEMVEERIKSILKESVKNLAGRGKDWAMKLVDQLTETADNDYPNKGIKEYFDELLHIPTNVNTILYNFNENKKDVKRG